MKNLEQIMIERKEEFDYAEPDNGHFERFMGKIPERKPKIWLTGIAASIAIAVFLGVSGYFISTGSQKEALVSTLPAEMEETLYYYESVNQEKENRIFHMIGDDNQETKRIINDIDQGKQEYEVLLNDLIRYPNNQRIFNAIIEYHRSKSELLELIMLQLDYQNV